MYFDHTFSNTIVGVVRGYNGDITAYKLDNGETVSKEQALYLSKQTAIKGVSPEVSRLGKEFLDSLPDKDKDSYLQNLPVVEE
ncbi:MAG: DUF3892 domain-containing protein [Clostridiaceae bacterium]